MLKKSLLVLSLSLAFAAGFIFLNSNPAGAATGCVSLTYNMQYGSTDASTNGEVTKLQDFLVDGGYGSFSGRGAFGPLTRDAVKRFQSSQGIYSGGYVGPITRAKIQSLTCGTGGTASSLSPASGPIGTQITLTASRLSPTGNTAYFAVAGTCYEGCGEAAITGLSSLNGTISFRIPSQIRRFSGGVYQNIAVTPGNYVVFFKNASGVESTNDWNFTVTATTPVQTIPPPTANLTVNGGENATITVGSSATLAWSSTNRGLFSSSITSVANLAGATCEAQITSINTGSGSQIFSGAKSGCTYTITYRVVGVKGEATDSVSIKVNPLVSVTPLPTATLTANGVHNPAVLTVNVGDTINYNWSSTNGALFNSVYTNSCAPGIVGEWSAFTNRGSSSGVVASSQAGCTYEIIYTVSGVMGFAQDKVTIRVNPITTGSASSSQTASILQTIANILSSSPNYLVGSVRSTLLDLFDQLQRAKGQ